MIKKLLIYNSGGGIGDSIQLLPLINTLKNELKNTNFYYLSAHKNHFDTTIKDFNCNLENLDLDLRYFGFRWWHIFIANKNIFRVYKPPNTLRKIFSRRHIELALFI